MRWSKSILLGWSFVLGLSSYAVIPQFSDVTASAGISQSKAEQEQPVAWCDYDQDGWVDFLVYGKLWKNLRGQSFELQKTPGHMSGGGVWGDCNNDGWPDVYMYITGHLFLNDGDGTFTLQDSFLINGSENHENCVAATWGDFDGDGYADLYLAGYEASFRGPISDDVILLTREGTTVESVWCDEQYIARGVTGCDFDRDSDYDLYVSNYRLSPNTLWVNDGSGVFQNRAAVYNVQSIERGWSGSHSVGAHWADFDNDGYFDIFSANFSHRGTRWGGDGIQPDSDFFRNRGPGGRYYFEDLGNCGVVWQESYASPACGDFDNDGFVDLFITTIYSTASSGEQNRCALFRNNGDWTFSEVSSSAGLGVSIQATVQAAWADFDNDGFLDLMTAGKLYRNGGNDNQWLKVKLIDGGRSTLSNLGAQVIITNGDLTHSRQVEGSVGQANANDPTLHFGLGKNPELPLTLEVRWTDGSRQMEVVREVNTLLKIEKLVSNIGTARALGDYDLVGGSVSGQ